MFAQWREEFFEPQVDGGGFLDPVVGTWDNPKNGL